MEWWLAFLAVMKEFGSVFTDPSFWIFMLIVVPPYLAVLAYCLIKYSKEDRFMRVLSLPENVKELTTEFSKPVTVILADTFLEKKYTIKNVDRVHITRDRVTLLCSDSSLHDFGFTGEYCNVAEDESVLSIRVNEFTFTAGN